MTIFRSSSIFDALRSSAFPQQPTDSRRKDHLEGNCLQGCNVCLDYYLFLYLYFLFLSLSTEVSEFVFVSVFLLATDRKDRLE